MIKIEKNYKNLYKKEKNIRKELEIKLQQKILEINKLQEKNNELNKLMKGFKSSLNGNIYEKEVFNILKKCYINNKLFNSQNENELGGSSSKNDINCNYLDIDIGIEIKKYKTPDWMQCSIKYDKLNKIWIASKGKNNEECQKIFNNLINKLNLYNGDIPPFMEKSITHKEWLNIKKETNKWNDKYIDIPNDTIRKLYYAKGCKYIQISNGYGLYHLGNDICKFNVPLFELNQQLRIRTKIHSKENSKGFCNLSVTIACQPKNLKELTISKYSLDCENKLPINLKINNK
jgi:hypothetical protein